jgi:3-hydroxyisobutyrate dehydrogenase-like beta-hydroxyacid dehydrogenase
MGSVFSKRFLRAGFGVLGFDPVAAGRQALEDAGGKAAAGVGEVFTHCECVLLSLLDSSVTRKVLTELKPESACRIIIDTTTGQPSDAEEFAQSVQDFGARYLDAPVAASSVQLEEGSDVTVMVGGDGEAIGQCHSIFSSFATRTLHVGGPGNGARMKLVSNLILGLNRAALAEGLHLAKLLGIEPAVLKEVLPQTKARSPIMASKLDKMLTEDFSPHARLSQHLKDVRLMLDLAMESGSRLPLSETHAALLEAAEALGFGDADNCAVLKAYSRRE